MSGKRYAEEFKIEAVKQATGRGYAVTDVASRLDISTKSLYHWIKKYADSGSLQQTISGQ